LKKITHLEENGQDYKETESRYYFKKELILIVLNSVYESNIGEKINISGKLYKIIDVLSYPELLLIDYTLKEENE
jgi:hypothetical protein